MKKFFRVLLPFLLCFSVCFSMLSLSVGGKEEDRNEIYSLFCDLTPYEVALLESAVEATVPEGSFALRVSVASVILNRLDSPLYPDSLPKIVRGSSFLEDGSAVPSKKTRQAVLSALLGASPVFRSTHALKLTEDEEIPAEAVSFVVIDGWVFWE